MHPMATDSTAFSNNPCTNKRSTPPLQRKPLKKRKIVIRQKPSVRFNEEAEIHKPRVFKTPLLPSSTWLKQKDLVRIRDGIFSTLDAIKRKKDAGFRWNDTNKGKHCARGLEDYSVNQKGSLKASTIHRRQNAIRAVLHEQEVQLKRHRQLQAAIPKHNRKLVPLHQPILDHTKLSKVYQKQTSFNIHEAIHMGRIDSEQALRIYSERSELQQAHPRRLILPSTKSSAPKTNNNKKLETTW
eukprot:CAMPEP_0116115130 /NCGR_PEP_ID=MMETSP0329-20121206/343_1 /TAXON_ID=697910 /ORGANISM="Pseudo-nitzschia arenysensis, Strain B593" /LENGTH=240 /DNA_ID=CAMNT_0003608543 /DNA_START=120 /DNA_END=839 /DNA_ORIENTATION=+